MTTIRKATRLLLASVTVGLGASFATAKDKTPAKPNAAPATKQHAAPVAKPDEAPKVQGNKVEDLKKPNNFSFGAQPTKGVKESAKITPEANKPNGLTYQKIESVKSPRDAASGQAMGKTKSPLDSKLQGPDLDATKAVSTAKYVDPFSRSDASTQKNGENNKKFLHVISGAIKIARGKIDEGYDEIATAVKKDPAKTEGGAGSSTANSNPEGYKAGGGTGSK